MAIPAFNLELSSGNGSVPSITWLEILPISYDRRMEEKVSDTVDVCCIKSRHWSTNPVTVPRMRYKEVNDTGIDRGDPTARNVKTS